MVWDILKKIGGLFVLLLLISACGDVGGSGQCGGVGETGSCIQIESIQPTDGGSTNTSNVDAFITQCTAAGTSTPATFEKFTDHSADIVVSNTPLPGVLVGEISDVTLLNYTISYSLNQCPDGATCPVLDILTVKPGQTTLVRANERVTFSVPFVPLAAKFSYQTRLGSEFAFPSYTANYTFTGTDSFKNSISVKGSAEFTIGNYNNCST